MPAASGGAQKMRGAGSPTHAPAAQVSTSVHGFASSHGAVLSTWPQAPAPSQRSSVQTLASGVHGVVGGLGACAHAPAPSQRSSVHSMPSVVQLVNGDDGGWMHAAAPLQTSSVHSMPSVAHADP